MDRVIPFGKKIFSLFIVVALLASAPLRSASAPSLPLIAAAHGISQQYASHSSSHTDHLSKLKRPRHVIRGLRSYHTATADSAPIALPPLQLTRNFYREMLRLTVREQTPAFRPPASSV